MCDFKYERAKKRKIARVRGELVIGALICVKSVKLPVGDTPKLPWSKHYDYEAHRYNIHSSERLQLQIILRETNSKISFSYEVTKVRKFVHI